MSDFVNVSPYVGDVSDVGRVNSEARTSSTTNVNAYGGDSLMANSVATFFALMAMFTEFANQKFSEMQQKTETAREAQDMANRVEAVMAKLVKAEDTAALPEDVVDYMRDNNILVDGKTIDEFLGGTLYGQTSNIVGLSRNNADVPLDAGDLKAVKSALESVSSRASDYVSQDQLKLTQYTQNYNTAATMVNSVQSAIAELNKRIASSIG